MIVNICNVCIYIQQSIAILISTLFLIIRTQAGTYACTHSGTHTHTDMHAHTHTFFAIITVFGVRQIETTEECYVQAICDRYCRLTLLYCQPYTD